MSFWKNNKANILAILRYALAMFLGGGAMVAGGAYMATPDEVEPVQVEWTGSEDIGTIEADDPTDQYYKYELWCDCTRYINKRTNVAGSPNQAEVPYIDQDTKFRILRLVTNQKRITEDWAKAFAVCGNEEKLTRLIRYELLGPTQPPNSQ